VSGSVVAYIGKRGETRNSLTDQVQEERDGLARRLAEKDVQIAALEQQRHDYLVRITQLEIENIRLGGNPTP
jgi:seryl-tRNA synthetase